MITLAGEVIYYRKRALKDKRNVKKTTKNIENDKIMQKIASKLQLKPAPTDPLFSKQLGSQAPRVSHISVYPRHFSFKEWAAPFKLRQSDFSRVSSIFPSPPKVHEALLTNRTYHGSQQVVLKTNVEFTTHVSSVIHAQTILFHCNQMKHSTEAK